jgi:hypothetical protein
MRLAQMRVGTVTINASATSVNRGSSLSSFIVDQIRAGGLNLYDIPNAGKRSRRNDHYRAAIVLPFGYQIVASKA